MSDGIFLLLIIGWLVLIVLYNNWLIAKKAISALRLGRIVAAAFDFFLWAAATNADEFSLALLLWILCAAFVLFMIFALNYHECHSVLHAVLMTLFQLTGGFILFFLFYGISRNKRTAKHKK